MTGILFEDDDEILDVICDDGAKGDKGDKGDKGETGADGATGPQGPAGDDGTNAVFTEQTCSKSGTFMIGIESDGTIVCSSQNLDLAVVTLAIPNDVSVLLGTGTGLFGPATSFAAGSSSFSDPRSISSSSSNSIPVITFPASQTN